MGGKRRLRAGLQRVYPDHRGPDGVAYRRYYAALAEELPLATPLLRLEASRAAMLGVLALNATRALTAAQAKARGNGRRPSPRAIERLARRQGLADGSYSQALDKLRELFARRKPVSLAERLSRPEAES
jgi:hypothetical protein